MDNRMEALVEFLKVKGIIQSLENNEHINIGNKAIDKQLNIIARFHEGCKGYCPKLWNKIPDKRGSLLQKYKNKQKIAFRFIYNMKGNKNNNIFEEFLSDTYSEQLKKSERILVISNNKNYCELLKRSMNKNEICIGDSSFINLWGDKQIYYKNLSNLCLDMYENDVLYLLIKLKREGYNLNWNHFINRFCEIDKLDDYSKEYIFSLLDYPYDFIKYTIRYFIDKEIRNEEISYEKSIKYINKISI